MHCTIMWWGVASLLWLPYEGGYKTFKERIYIHTSVVEKIRIKFVYWHHFLHIQLTLFLHLLTLCWFQALAFENTLIVTHRSTIIGRSALFFSSSQLAESSGQWTNTSSSWRVLPLTACLKFSGCRAIAARYAHSIAQKNLYIWWVICTRPLRSTASIQSSDLSFFSPKSSESAWRHAISSSLRRWDNLWSCVISFLGATYLKLFSSRWEAYVRQSTLAPSSGFSKQSVGNNYMCATSLAALFEKS